MNKVNDAAAAAAAAGRSGHGVNDEGNKENRHSDAKHRFKSEEEIVSKDDQIELTKAEMSEVRLENQRLRMHLERLTKDYQTLQTQFQDIIVQQDATRRGINNNVTSTTMASISSLSSQQDVEEHDISLRLGRTSSSSLKKEVVVMNKNHDNDSERGLSLGLDSSSKQVEGSKTDRRCSTEPLTNNTSTDNSFDQEEEEKKEDIMGETWPPPKMLKRNGEDEIDSHHNNGKRARVSVRARCDTPTMNDGCQWRKYGQKIAKGNPCPRAYYRCTVAPSCPVRKQVQRCAEDMSILITTYEGTHNHPLASAATAMASTTSAAASMLLSGSSTSSRHAGLGQSTTSATTTSVGLHGLTYNLANGTTLSQPNRSQQFYIQNNSHISSSLNTHPTITLDLTTSNPFANSFTNPHFNRFSSSTSYEPSQLFSSKSTSLNFSSIDSSNNPQTTSLSWATNNPSNALGYRNMYPQSNNRNNHNLGSLTLSSSNRYPQEKIYQSFMQKPNNNSSALHINHHQQLQQPHLPDHIAAATKAITADPSFQTALAAALTSIIGGTGGGGSVATNSNSEKMQVSSIENLSQKMKWVDQKGTNGCGSSYLSNTSSVSNAQTSGLMLLQPSLAASKSKSNSPSENKQDHNAS